MKDQDRTQNAIAESSATALRLRLFKGCGHEAGFDAPALLEAGAG